MVGVRTDNNTTRSSSDDRINRDLFDPCMQPMRSHLGEGGGGEGSGAGGRKLRVAAVRGRERPGEGARLCEEGGGGKSGAFTHSVCGRCG